MRSLDDSGIYALTVFRPGKASLFYIGQASHFGKRKSRHFAALRRGGHDNWRLQALFEKYGESSLRFDTILVCRAIDLSVYEQATLNFYLKSYGRRVLNICRKCSISTLGTRRNERSRLKMSEAKRGRPGRVWSEESRAKLRAHRIGSRLSDRARAMLIERNTGRKLSKETRRKISEGNRGKRMSDEAKAKISAARRRAELDRADVGKIM